MIGSSFKSLLNYTSTFVGIAATLGSGAAAAFLLSEKLKANELSFGGASLLAVAAFGAFSLYIARVAKRLVRRPRIFLSYSQDNAQQASMLRDALSKRGAHIWFDKTELRPGDEIKATIESAIESSNAVVLMVSDRPGPYVKWELDAARKRHVPVLTVFIFGPDSGRPPGLEDLHTIVLNTDGSNFGEVAAAAMQFSKTRGRAEA